MWQLGHDNWIKYGWGPELKFNQIDPETEFQIDFSSCKISNSTPLEAAIDAVKKIVENYPAPYTLMCSGGVDSQAMILAWLASGYPFEIMSFRYISENIFFNDYDLVELDKLAESHHLTINYQDLDIISFLENSLRPLAIKIDCSSPQFCTHMKFADFVPIGTLIYSGNVLSNVGAALSYSMLGMHRYSIEIETENKKIIPFFFLHTPDLAYSFISNKLSDKEYVKAGFQVIFPHKKYNGFEKIKEYYDKYTRRVSSLDKLRYADRPSKRVFDQLFRYPYFTPSKDMKKTTFILKSIL